MTVILQHQWEDFVQLASANSFSFSNNDVSGATLTITAPNVKCGGNPATALTFFNAVTALIWQMLTAESKEPLEITDSVVVVVYIYASDSSGLSQESQILEER